MSKHRQFCVVLACMTISLFVLSATATLAESRDRMFERARNLAKEEDYKDAIQAMLDFQEEYPHDKRIPQSQYLIGRYEHKRNYLNAALKEYDYVVEDHPDSIYAARAMHKMADIYVHKEEYAEAVDILDKCATEFEDTPDGVHAMRRIGDVHDKADQTNRALDAFDKLIKRNHERLKEDADKSARRQINKDIKRGVMYIAKDAIDKEDYDRANEAYQALPDMWERVRRMIELLYMQEKFDKIHDIVDDMSDENYWQAQGLLMNFYIRRESSHGIKRLIRELTQEHDQSQRLTELFKPLEKELKDFPDEDREDIYELISTRYRPLRREFEFAICELVREEDPDYLERFITTYENGDDVEQCKRWRGIYFELQGERERAQKEYERMADTPRAHFYIAESHHGEYAREGGNVDRLMAIKEYMEIRKAFYDTEKTCEAYWRIAKLQRKMDDRDKAIDTLEELEQRFTGQEDWQVKARMRIANWLRKWERYEEAIDNYRLVDRRYPDTKEQRKAVYRIGLCHEKMGNKEKAIEAFHECVGRFDMTEVQSRAETRLEDKYEIPDLLIKDRAKEKAD